ncbi:hypothetical protein AAD001_11825 [Colwelliaceae bacterium 6471]
MLLFFAAIFCISCALFFYCQALRNGLGRKRWAFAGLVFGPLTWPIFCMKKRMRINQLFGLNGLILRA